MGVDAYARCIPSGVPTPTKVIPCQPAKHEFSSQKAPNDRSVNSRALTPQDLNLCHAKIDLCSRKRLQESGSFANPTVKMPERCVWGEMLDQEFKHPVLPGKHQTIFAL